jgi:hypothetical protein
MWYGSVARMSEAIVALLESNNVFPSMYMIRTVATPNATGIILAMVSTTPKIVNNIEIMDCIRRGCAL